jgi:hypothetical protein
VSHGEQYLQAFPVRYGSPRDVFAASSSFVRLNTLRVKERKKKKKHSGGAAKHNCTHEGKFTVVQVY